jgi:hypothetical protein
MNGRLLGRARHRWEDTIKMDLIQVRWEGVEWTHLSQNRDQWQALVDTVMDLVFHKRQVISSLAE